MTDADRESALKQITDEASGPLNGNEAVINSRIAAFEERYEMTSDELIERLKRNEQRETAEIVEWLSWLSLRTLVHG